MLVIDSDRGMTINNNKISNNIFNHLSEVNISRIILVEMTLCTVGMKNYYKTPETHFTMWLGENGFGIHPKILTKKQSGKDTTMILVSVWKNNTNNF